MRFFATMRKTKKKNKTKKNAKKQKILNKNSLPANKTPHFDLCSHSDSKMLEKTQTLTLYPAKTISFLDYFHILIIR